MTDIFKDQSEFMQACEQTTTHLNINQAALYMDLITEEFQEFIQSDSRENAIKEAIDILVVTAGWLLSAGVDCDEAWYRVWSSNMSKLTNGKIIRREDGKILKPSTYKEPNMTGL